MTLAPGTTLGRYQIVEPLGQGGMATVYKAFQPALERTVALKVIRRGFAEDPEFRERFQREAKAIARLRHPNIVDVFDFDEADGQVFLAMQYVEGGTLKDRLARLAERSERMPQEETAAVVRQVAAALAYAHARGVIHRDVKPSNVMLGEDGTAIVTDFGIAKIVGGTQHTATGVGIGTPEYMSPEQGQGQALDGRTDEYALAVTAYEMLTGTLPYTADTPFAVVLKHVRDPLPLPSRIEPAVSARTEQVLLRALAKDPADRYPTVTEFAAELERSIAERPGRTLPTVVTPRRAASAPTERVPAAKVPAALLGRPLVLAAAGIGLLLLGGGGAAVLGAFATSTPSPTASANVAIATTASPTPTVPVTPTPTGTLTPTPTGTPTPTPTPTPAPATTAPVVVTTPPPPTPTPRQQWTLHLQVYSFAPYSGSVSLPTSGGTVTVTSGEAINYFVGDSPRTLRIAPAVTSGSAAIWLAWTLEATCKRADNGQILFSGVPGLAPSTIPTLQVRSLALPSTIIDCDLKGPTSPGELWATFTFDAIPAAATATPTPSPTPAVLPTPTLTPPTARPVSASAQDLIMTQADLSSAGYSGYTVALDRAESNCCAIGWRRDFGAQSNWDRLNLRVYVYPPGSDVVTSECSNYAPISGATVGERSGLCRTFTMVWGQGYGMWSASRNVIVELDAFSAGPVTDQAAADVLVALVRRQLDRVDRISPP